ncbi:MAG: hypothetical protein ACJ8R9_22090 [Steroidobacteraceae bacterium]
MRPWSVLDEVRDLRALKTMARSGIGATQTAKKMGRTAAAVQQKAMRSGISFRARKKNWDQSFTSLVLLQQRPKRA